MEISRRHLFLFVSCLLFVSTFFPFVVPFRKGNKWGLVNEKKEIIIPVRYDDLRVSGKYILVKENQKFGLFLPDGKEILKPGFEKIEIFRQLILASRKGGSFICDSTGKKISKKFYDNISVRDSLLVAANTVGTMNMEGVLSGEGKEILAPEWQSVRRFDRYLSAIKRKGNLEFQYYFSAEGKKLKLEGQRVSVSAEGNIALKQKDAYALFSPAGKKLSDSYSGILLNKKTNTFLVQDGIRVGVINSEGKIIIPLIHSNYYPDPNSENRWMMKDGLFGLLELKSGKKIIDYSYTKVQPAFVSGERLYLVKKQDDLVGVISGAGEILFAAQFDSIYHFNKEIAIGEIKGEVTIVNRSGEKSLVQRKNAYRYFEVPSDGMIAVLESKYLGFIDYSGKEIISPQYDLYKLKTNQGEYSLFSFQFYKGRCPVLKGDSAFLIDKSNTIISGIGYRQIQEEPQLPVDTLTNDFAVKSKQFRIVNVSGKFGILGKNYEVLLPVEYQQVSPVDKTFLSVTKNGKCALMDKEMKLRTDFKYDYISPYDEKLFFVTVNGKNGFLGKDMTEYFEE
jgi:hypothetical protein